MGTVHNLESGDRAVDVLLQVTIRCAQTQTQARPSARKVTKGVMQVKLIMGAVVI